ncbi:MiaB/RimO family radical SAM methylthiotransferase [Candidatus Woesearchaeota archaeon]|nr:MiaB/RimO family radical SAM methylthiotransferase [Candidatus Woesearchaeota archaeon]
MHTIHIMSNPCSLNNVHAEQIAGLLHIHGFIIEKNIKAADILISVVCPVIDELTMLVEIKQLIKAHKKKKIILAGCLSQKMVPQVRKITHTASLVSSHNISGIVGVVEEVINGNAIDAVSYQEERKLHQPRVRINPFSGIIPLQPSCDHHCPYCEFHLSQKHIVSYKKEDILKEVHTALRDGCKEIIVASHDVSSYATEEIWRSSLPELLKEILAIDHPFKLRMGKLNVKNIKPILDELIEIFKSDKVYKYLFLPLLSGNDAVLNTLEAGYTVDDFRNIINRFRTEIPNLTIATEVVIGHPGENVEGFNESLEVIREMRPDSVSITKSESKHTERVEENVVKDRMRIIHDISKNISRMNNERWLDWQGEILIDERGKGDSWVGRNFSYKPVMVNGDYSLGQTVQVKVITTDVNQLKAERI